MSLLDETHSSYTQTSKEYYEDELKNSRVLLFKINEAISTISSGSHQEYTLDTGQSRQTVKRIDLPALIDRRDKLIGHIRQLELYLREGRPNVKQVRPDW